MLQKILRNNEHHLPKSSERCKFTQSKSSESHKQNKLEENYAWHTVKLPKIKDVWYLT